MIFVLKTNKQANNKQIPSQPTSETIKKWASWLITDTVPLTAKGRTAADSRHAADKQEIKSIRLLSSTFAKHAPGTCEDRATAASSLYALTRLFSSNQQLAWSTQATGLQWSDCSGHVSDTTTYPVTLTACRKAGVKFSSSLQSFGQYPATLSWVPRSQAGLFDVLGEGHSSIKSLSSSLRRIPVQARNPRASI